MQEMDELYKDRPTQTNTYEVEGVRHTVISHFIGDRDINDVTSFFIVFPKQHNLFSESYCFFRYGAL